MSNDKKDEGFNVTSPDFSNVGRTNFADVKKTDFSNVQSGSTSTAPTAARPDFGNVQSGSTSTARSLDEVSTTHTVEKGESLSLIAKHHYGKASMWREIFEANRDQIDDPDRIMPGQVLKIPAADGHDHDHG